MTDKPKENAQLDPSSAAPETPPRTEASSVEGPGWKMDPRAEAPQPKLPPIDFTSFCLSLASSALIHLGEVKNPETGAVEQNLSLGQQSIDVLAMLEEKTRGNLTPDEARLLSTLLYDLRLRFLQKRQP